MSAYQSDDDYPGREYDLRHAPWHFEPALDFLLWFRPELTEAEAKALIERFEHETAPLLRNFKPDKGVYLPQAMRQYWGVPLRPDAAMPETNIVTLFTPPKL